MASYLVKFSRRTFLGFSAALSVAVGIGRGSWTIPSLDNIPGVARSFALTTVYSRPDITSPVSGMLAPHSVHAIKVIVERGWYQTEHGYVLRTAMQPIKPYVPPVIEKHSAAPFWAEVIAPISTSRAWCSAKAPMVVTWGYGAVTQILGTLIDDYSIVWYETINGWFDARQWQQVAVPNRNVSQKQARSVLVHLDPRQRQISVIPTRNGQIKWQTTYYGGITIKQPVTMSIQTERPCDDSGSSWLMRLENNILVRGGWDHNQFGFPGGTNVFELPIIAAKRLYMESIEFTV